MKKSENILFRKGYLTDLPMIEKMFQSAIVEMNRNNIPQWDEIYPNIEILKEDLIHKQLYVGTVEDILYSVFVLNQEEDEQYANGTWKYKMSSFYVIHRLCVNPAFQNEGIGSRTMKYIEKLLKELEIETIRLDAFSLNPYALKMYHSLGYSTVGEAHWRKGMFYLMEKKL